MSSHLRHARKEETREAILARRLADEPTGYPHPGYQRRGWYHCRWCDGWHRLGVRCPEMPPEEDVEAKEERIRNMTWAWGMSPSEEE